MKDNAITDIIAKTYTAVIFTFLLISFLFIGLFIVLQNGLYLDNLSISNTHLKNIYIKWDERLSVSVENLDITSDKEQKSSHIRFKTLSRSFKALSHTTNWFDSIVIESIHINDMQGSFHYVSNTPGFLTLHSPTLSLESSLAFQAHILQLQLEKFEDKKRAINARGNILFDTDTEQGYAKIALNIHDDADLRLYMLANKQKLIYNVQSNKDIKDISHLIEIAHLPKEVVYWAYTAIEMDHVTINEFHGFIDYNNPQEAYKNLYISAMVDKLNYTYNPKLDAVHTQRTELEFKRGVLYIRPKDAYSYGMFLDKSWLKIDFTKPEELLTLHLLFDGMLNKDMLHILKTYEIDVPFLQHQGKITTDLTLTVNLQHVNQVNVIGDFYTPKANFDYLGLNIDIVDTHMRLHNYLVDIDKMKASYKNIAQASITAKYNAKTAQGKIDFLFQKIEKEGLHLNTEKDPLHVTYTIAPKQDAIAIPASQWKYNNKTISLDALSVDFDLTRLSANIPITYFSVDNFANGYINGQIDLKSSLGDFDIDLLKFDFNGITLAQTSTLIKLQFQENLHAYSKKDIVLNVNGSEYRLKNLNVTFDDNTFFLKRTSLEMGKYITTKIYANYNIESKKIHASLSNFTLKNPKTDKVLYKNSKILLGGNISDNNITIYSKELDAGFSLDKEKWNLTLNSISTITDKSPFLQKYHIKEGKVSFFKNREKPYTQFNAQIISPYPFLIKDGKNIYSYTLTGDITKEYNTYVTINKNIHIKFSEDIKIKIHDVGLNTNAIIDFTKKVLDSNSTQSNIKLSLDAINSELYLGNKRKAISDAMHLQYYNKILTAQLVHKKGNAGFRLEGNKFHLYGKNFNDQFMQNLLVLSKFSGGSLDFVMDGTLDDYHGVLYMYDMTMIDYKLLNNVLAFINTVPSLVTFSLPGYSKKGLHVENAYMKFHAKKGLFDVSDIYLKSKEITILGRGTADINKNSIDITLNLKTDLGSNVSKIPLVGYIIFDGKNISTTLKVTGKLDDPTVNTTVAKDIVVAPLNIIKRTITLPFKFLKNLY